MDGADHLLRFFSITACMFGCINFWLLMWLIWFLRNVLPRLSQNINQVFNGLEEIHRKIRKVFNHDRQI